MKMTYIASSGNMYDLTATRIRAKEANFHTWEYDPKAINLIYGERLSYFKREALKYEAVFVVRGSITQRRAILTALHDDFERDVRTQQNGRLMYGEWYCECYMTASKTAPNEDVNHWTENEVTIYVPSGYWLKTEEKTFGANEEQASTYLDYTYDYSYDYKSASYGSGSWATDAPFDSDFSIEIYGPVVNPRVTINGWPYVVYATIASGETLVIDSRAKTVMCGNTNLFNARNKQQSVFQKIPSGTLALTWGNFAFKLTLYEERSEPKW